MSNGAPRLLMLKVPTASMSMTVVNPLEESCSAGDRKFPAAQLTRMSSLAQGLVVVFSNPTASHGGGRESYACCECPREEG